MLQMVLCDHCGTSGTFPLHLEYTYQVRGCDHCHHRDYDKWRYYFCNSECMFTWMKENDIENQGFPCQSCVDYTTGKPTGFAHGFESNGVCKTCKGTLKVKG